MKATHTKSYYAIVPEAGQQEAGYSGLTLTQSLDLQQLQSRGTQPMVKCSEDDRVQIQECDAKIAYMVALENPLFDQSTGERIDSGVNYQKFNIPAWNQIMESGFNPSQKTVIIHNPLNYLKRLADEKEEAKQDKKTK